MKDMKLVSSVKEFILRRPKASLFFFLFFILSYALPYPETLSPAVTIISSIILYSWVQTRFVKWYLSDTGDLNFYLSIGDIKAIYRIIILTLTIMIASILFFLIFYSALWAHTQTSTTDLLAAIDSSVFNKYSTFINSLILAIVYLMGLVQEIQV